MKEQPTILTITQELCEDGKERYTIDIPDDLPLEQELTTTDKGRILTVRLPSGVIFVTQPKEETSCE